MTKRMAALRLNAVAAAEAREHRESDDGRHGIPVDEGSGGDLRQHHADERDDDEAARRGDFVQRERSVPGSPPAAAPSLPTTIE